MNNYKFYIEQKQISWDTSIYNIEANSKEEAEALAKEIFTTNVNNRQPDDFYSSGDIVDMDIDFKQNGNPTRILYFEDKQIKSNSNE